MKNVTYVLLLGVAIILISGCGRISTEVDLSAPSDLTAIVIDSIKIRLDWKANNDLRDGFMIERKKLNEDYVLLITVNQNDTTFIDITVSNNVTYYYRICTYINSDKSDYSNIANATCHQDEIYVPEDFSSIQSAIENTISGNTILVLPGAYIENINFIGKNIILTSTNGPESTIIDGNQSGRVVTINSGEDSSAVLCGFTITNGLGGICCDYYSNISLINLIIKENSAVAGGGISGSPIMKNVVVCDNYASDSGGGIYGSPTMNNVIIYNNTADFWGGGIYCGFNRSPYMVNVVVSNNISNINCGNGIYLNPILVNCIIWGNPPQDISVFSDSLESTYSNIQDGWIEGNISEDPLFIDPENGDFHLQTNSPCINTGNPDPQYIDTDGTRNDMGAYGGPNGNW